MVLKESQLKELLRGIVREVLAEFDTRGVEGDLSAVGDMPDAELDPIAQQKRERDLRAANRDELQIQQKALKFQKDKKRADDKMWKMNKKSGEEKIRALKRSGV